MNYSAVAFPCNGNQSKNGTISSDPRHPPQRQANCIPRHCIRVINKRVTVDEISKEEGGINDVRHSEVQKEIVERSPMR